MALTGYAKRCRPGDIIVMKESEFSDTVSGIVTRVASVPMGIDDSELQITIHPFTGFFNRIRLSLMGRLVIKGDNINEKTFPLHLAEDIAFDT
jgi:hypothetical protein